MTALTAEFVERQYNLRAAFPDHLAWFERWAADSEKARSRLDNVLDVRYGRGPKQTLDLFPAANPRGLLLFLHGGYWRALDKGDFSFVAAPLVERGIAVALVNYDLCPSVAVATIVDQCRRSMLWLVRIATLVAMACVATPSCATSDRDPSEAIGAALAYVHPRGVRDREAGLGRGGGNAHDVGRGETG